MGDKTISTPRTKKHREKMVIEGKVRYEISSTKSTHDLVVVISKELGLSKSLTANELLKLGIETFLKNRK